MNTKNKIALLFSILFFTTLSFANNVLKQPVELQWYPTTTVAAQSFSNFSSGNTLFIKYENLPADYHQIKIYSGQWTNFSEGNIQGAQNQNGALIPDSNSGVIAYTPTPKERNLLKKEGLLMHGFGMKIISITYGKTYDTPKNPKVETSKKEQEKPQIKQTETQTPQEPAVAKTEPKSKSGTPFAQHGPLHVEGAYLYDKNNQKYQLYGMSTHGIAWFPGYVNKNAFKTLRDDWNTNCIRLALYPREYNGYCAGGNKSQLKQIIFDGIEAATELGMYVIVDWHVLAYNPNELSSQAIEFFQEISSKYANYKNVIYEICNEPTNSRWNQELKPYAEKLIPVIRKNAPDSIIIVGTNTWSQDLEDPANSPLQYKNIMYAFHFYADTHTQHFRNRLESAIQKGLPVFVTEFGTCNASGNGGFNPSQTQKWFELLDKYSISHMNWSLCNKSETASVIQPSCTKLSDWQYTDLTSSGQLIYNHFRALKP